MHFLITAGGTVEYIDPVRFITNASSGKMGYALARAALKAGHKVTLVSAPTKLQKPVGARLINVQTSKEMFDAVKEHFLKCNCLIMAAAVSDYTVAHPSKNKIKKTDAALTIKLKPTKDILKWASGHKKGRIVVGFALEDKSLRAAAEAKLKAKKLDMIVANSPRAIAAYRSTVHIKTPGQKWLKLADITKTSAAKTIIKLVEKRGVGSCFGGRISDVVCREKAVKLSREKM